MALTGVGFGHRILPMFDWCFAQSTSHMERMDQR